MSEFGDSLLDRGPEFETSEIWVFQVWGWVFDTPPLCLLRYRFSVHTEIIVEVKLGLATSFDKLLFLFKVEKSSNFLFLLYFLFYLYCPFLLLTYKTILQDHGLSFLTALKSFNVTLSLLDPSVYRYNWAERVYHLFSDYYSSARAKGLPRSRTLWIMTPRNPC